MYGVIEKFDLQGFSGWVRIEGEVSAELSLRVSIDGVLVDVNRSMNARPDLRCGYGFSAKFSKPLESYPRLETIEINAVCGSNVIALVFYEPARLAVQLARLTDSEKAHLVRNLDFETRNLVLNSAFGVDNLSGDDLGRRSVCVVTYANGSGGWFPYFYDHYKNRQGVDGVFVITPKPREFCDYALDGLISVEGAEYNDYSIANIFSSISNGLKSYFKYVLVCDVDELIFPTPGLGVNLKQFVEKSTEAVYVGLGIDVIQTPGESDFDFEKSVADNRGYGILNSAICKPFLSSSAIKYFIGQHYCNYPVQFLPWNEGLVCYHMKWACAAVRNRVLGIVEKTSYAFDDIAKYSSQSVEVSIPHPAWNLAKNKVFDFNSSEVANFKNRYIQQRFYNSNYGVFSGSHFLGDFLIKLI